MATEYTAGYRDLNKKNVLFTDPSGEVREGYDIALHHDENIYRDWWRPRTDVLEDGTHIAIDQLKMIIR
jgi:hypothetical protein